MRRVVIALLLLAGCATTTPAPDVREAHSLRFLTMLRGDVDALAPMLADDLVYIHTTTDLETKSQFLEQIRSGATRYQSIEPSETVVRTFGSMAIVTGRARVKVTFKGADRDVDMRYTAVYRLSPANKWQLVSWQSTRVP